MTICTSCRHSLLCHSARTGCGIRGYEFSDYGNLAFCPCKLGPTGMPSTTAIFSTTIDEKETMNTEQRALLNSITDEQWITYLVKRLRRTSDELAVMKVQHPEVARWVRQTGERRALACDHIRILANTLRHNQGGSALILDWAVQMLEAVGRLPGATAAPVVEEPVKSQSFEWVRWQQCSAAERELVIKELSAAAAELPLGDGEGLRTAIALLRTADPYPLKFDEIPLPPFEEPKLSKVVEEQELPRDLDELVDGLGALLDRRARGRVCTGEEALMVPPESMIQWCKCGHGVTWHHESHKMMCCWDIAGPDECACNKFELEEDPEVIKGFVAASDAFVDSVLARIKAEQDGIDG